MSESPTSAVADARVLRRLAPTWALWLKGLILMSFLAASSVPSPLYALYRTMWGFSAVTLTVVFASYALAMLAALLVFGGLSDYRGRREVVLGALVLEIAAVLLFWRAESVAWLLAARVLQGVATGIATTALGAGLVDLHRERGALINSVAPMVGLGVGALGASLLVQFAPAPTRLVFDLLLGVFFLQLVAAWFLPETGQRRPGALRSLLPKMEIPPSARATLRRLLPVNTAQWALGGFYFSLGPSVARAMTQDSAPVVGGVLIGALSLSSAAAIALTRRLPVRVAITGGAGTLVAGVLMTLAGLHWHSSTAAFVGTLVSGAGFGTVFSASVRSLMPLAQAHERAALMAGFFTASYLAFSLPAVVAGLLTHQFGLHSTALGYGLATAVLALTAFVPARAARTA